MPSDAIPGMRHSGEPTRSSLLTRELHFADSEYRSLALHAGPLHRLTLDAKRRVDQIAWLLRAEIERVTIRGDTGRA